jgi:hypothetical protein
LVLSVLILVVLLILDVLLFIIEIGLPSILTITLALIATAHLLPYVLYVYPFPRMPSYYEDFMRQPWLFR